MRLQSKFITYLVPEEHTRAERLHHKHRALIRTLNSRRARYMAQPSSLSKNFYRRAHESLLEFEQELQNTSEIIELTTVQEGTVL